MDRSEAWVPGTLFSAPLVAAEGDRPVFGVGPAARLGQSDDLFVPGMLLRADRAGGPVVSDQVFRLHELRRPDSAGFTAYRQPPPLGPAGHVQRLPGEAAGEPEESALLDGDDREPVVGHQLLQERVLCDNRGDPVAARGDHGL
jgi:hypothetical protein